MFGRIFLICFINLCTSQAVGSPLLGTWNCSENQNGHQMWSQNRFTKSGRMIANLIIHYKEAGQVVARSQARYKARYRIENGRFIDEPVSARVTKFIAFGKDVRGGEQARTLKESLMRNDGDHPRLKFDNPVKFRLIREDRTSILCQKDSSKSLG